MRMDKNEIEWYVHENIISFHNSKLDSLSTLKLDTILKRKNPYLYKAKNILKPHSMVEYLLDAYLSSQEEALFGEFLEKLAIFICSKTKNGYKSGVEGIDLEFTDNKIRYLVTIKSGPNWGNSGQINRMKDDFKKASKILKTTNSGLHIQFVNGCCYGRDNKPDKGEYHKLCGQAFWKFISGDENLYIDIIEPLGYEAKTRNDAFDKEYAKVITRFTEQFIQEYCNEDRSIHWEKIVRLNSGEKVRISL
jgi:hypothetical protein